MFLETSVFSLSPKVRESVDFFFCNTFKRTLKKTASHHEHSIKDVVKNNKLQTRLLAVDISFLSQVRWIDFFVRLCFLAFAGSSYF